MAAQSEVVDAMITFLNDIGITTQRSTLSEPTFLPGIAIVNGGLEIDETQLRYPGDILHEAGHLAVAEASRRPNINGDAGGDPAEEMMAIGWSYAAVLAIGIDPAIVFHDDGYQGGGSSLLENFRERRFLGVPMLQWVGMTYDDQRAQAEQTPAYPHMIRWLRP